MAATVIPYFPRYPEVHKVLEAHRFCVLVAHRRFGKTVLSVNHLIKMAWLSAKPQPRFAYIAPFRNQAKTVAWDYLKRYTCPFPGRQINESELSVSLPACNGSRIRIFGADNPDALRGQYFDGVVMDEVAQMKANVWDEVVQPTLADRQGWALFIGTPKGINLFSDLYYKAVKAERDGDPDWRALSFPATDKTEYPPQSEIERLRRELSDNTFRQEMLCDFTATSDNILISLDAVNASLERECDPQIVARHPLILGVDVARFGEDASVIQPRRGPLAMPPVVMRKLSNIDVANRVIHYAIQNGAHYVNIDQGQGAGVIDMVSERLPASITVTEVPFGGRALDDVKYLNRRAEMWDRMRAWLSGGVQNALSSACLPQSFAQAYQSELTAPTYSFAAGGDRMKLEPKEDIKKRLKHSTDIGDALALTFAIDTPLLELETQRRSCRQREREYDPFAEL